MVYFADTVLEYFDSGAGPIPGPYGFFDPNGNGFIEDGEPGVGPISLSAVLGDDPAPGADALSLPAGSFITVGFQNELITDGPGNDIFIREMGAAGDRADVYVSADGLNYVYLGTALDNVTTSFDLATIQFNQPVQAVRIVGVDNQGASPGFDVTNVQVLQSIVNGRRLILVGTIDIDIILGGQYRDTLDGREGDDKIRGRDGKDVIVGGLGSDRIWAGRGNDRVQGNAGDDVLRGKAGNDILLGNGGADRLIGGDDNDWLRGGRGDDQLFGNDGRDRLKGGAGDDLLWGGEGDDVLKGGFGDDVLIGGEGNDSLEGGAGADRYVLALESGEDVIRGFQDGLDRIGLSGTLEFSDLEILSAGETTTVIQAGEEILATLFGVSANLITSADFV